MRVARIVLAAAAPVAVSALASAQITNLGLDSPEVVRWEERGPRFGTTDFSNLDIYAWEFHPLDERIITSPTAAGSFLKYVVSSGAPFGGGYLEAPVHLPDGASIESFGWIGCRSGPDSTAVLYYADAADGPSVVIATAHAISSDCGGSFAAFTPHTVQNGGRVYAVEVNLPVGSPDTALREVLISYRLQVSPPPETPTFADVPTDHPFFQFVEALYDAGITAGCGGNNFCPDQPLTRGQMAVFLSKALGLHWH